MCETEVAIRDQQLDIYTTEINGLMNGLMNGLESSKTRDSVRYTPRLSDAVQARLLTRPTPTAPQQDMDLVEWKLKDFETALDTMHLDLKGLDLSTKKKKYKAHKRNKKEWDTKLEFARKNGTRSELMDGQAKDPTASDFNTAAGMMAHGAAVQADTKSSLQRTLGVVAGAREVLCPPSSLPHCSL